MRGRITYIKRAKAGDKITKGCGSGFGFIQDAEGRDYFFLHGSVKGTAFDDLKDNLIVEFEAYDEPGRGLRAKDVQVVS